MISPLNMNFSKMLFRHQKFLAKTIGKESVKKLMVNSIKLTIKYNVNL